MLKFFKLAILILAIAACKDQSNKKEETTTTQHEEKQSDVSVPARLMCLIEALGVMMRRLADFLQPQRPGSK